MTYIGHIKNGGVVLDQPLDLPDGVEVRIEPVTAVDGENRTSDVWRKLMDISGTVEGLPPDAARQHDHYLYGIPKR